MTEKSADLSTVAARIAWLEEAFDWLKDNMSEGGEFGVDCRLWSVTVKYADNGLSDTPEDPAVKSIYGREGVSLHTNIFGLGERGRRFV